VWAIVRGLVPTTPTGIGDRPMAQRLEDGERVLWSGHPKASLGAWLPRSPRAIGTVALALMLGVSAWITGAHAIGSLRAVHRAGVPYGSSTFVLLVLSLSISIVMLWAMSLTMIYWAAVRPARLAAKTRYLVTDRRVLIQCGREELHLDREKIAHMIELPKGRGATDVFLVLDGPMARAMAASGAFGEDEVPGLKPVLLRVTDVEALRAVLGR
jgi:hypothetical protein